MTKRIFVDMDGVLTNFNLRYTERFGITPAEVRKSADRKLYSKYWNQFVDGREFATLDSFPGVNDMLNFIRDQRDKHKAQVMILTSSGGYERHTDVQEQKLIWLKNHGIEFPAIVVPGRGFKSGFASPTSFIIDDTADVIMNFLAKGGHGVLHTTTEKWNTCYTLERWIESTHGQ